MINRNLFLAVIIGCISFGKSNAQSGGTTPASIHTFTGKPQYQILTKRAGNLVGIINVELFPAIAPNHAKYFDSLVSHHSYDTTAFHRVIPGFMIQGGDPNSRHGDPSTWGYGDPSEATINAEFSPALHLRGTLSAARDVNINSASSQFFICVAPASWLNGQYSIYGQVTSGMNIADSIVLSPRDANDMPLQKIEMFVTYTGSNDSVPAAPALLLPVSGTQSVSTSKQLKWNTVGDGIIYRVEVSTDSLFSSLFRVKELATNVYTAGGLQGSTTYYWRVQVNNGGHWSNYSPVWNFSTNFNAAVNNLSFLEQGYRLDQNIPNPSSNQTLIKYAIPNKENVALKLFDITGKEIITLVNEEKTKGEYQVTVNLSKYPSGTYFYQIQAGDFSDTQKLILER